MPACWKQSLESTAASQDRPAPCAVSTATPLPMLIPLWLSQLLLVALSAGTRGRAASTQVGRGFMWNEQAHVNVAPLQPAGASSAGSQILSISHCPSCKHLPATRLLALPQHHGCRNCAVAEHSAASGGSSISTVLVRGRGGGSEGDAVVKTQPHGSCSCCGCAGSSALVLWN